MQDIGIHIKIVCREHYGEKESTFDLDRVINLGFQDSSYLECELKLFSEALTIICTHAASIISEIEELITKNNDQIIND